MLLLSLLTKNTSVLVRDYTRRVHPVFSGVYLIICSLLFTTLEQMYVHGFKKTKIKKILTLNPAITNATF